MGKIYVGTGPERLLGDLLAGSGKQIIEVYRGQDKIWPNLSHVWNYIVTNNDNSATQYLEWRSSGGVEFQVAQTGIGSKSGSLPQNIIDGIIAGQITHYWWYVRNNPTSGFISLNGSSTGYNVTANSGGSWGSPINLPLSTQRSTTVEFIPNQPIV